MGIAIGLSVKIPKTGVFDQKVPKLDFRVFGFLKKGRDGPYVATFET